MKRVLLVDDEQSVLFALTMLVQALGYEAEGYLHGQLALDAISQNSKAFDLLLCDLRMPEMNGMQVIAAARKIAPNLKITLMSGHATQEEVDMAHSIGVTNFLAKPFSAEQLSSVLA